MNLDNQILPQIRRAQSGLTDDDDRSPSVEIDPANCPCTGCVLEIDVADEIAHLRAALDAIEQLVRDVSQRELRRQALAVEARS